MEDKNKRSKKVNERSFGLKLADNASQPIQPLIYLSYDTDFAACGEPYFRMFRINTTFYETDFF